MQSKICCNTREQSHETKIHRLSRTENEPRKTLEAKRGSPLLEELACPEHSSAEGLPAIEERGEEGDMDRRRATCGVADLEGSARELTGIVSHDVLLCSQEKPAPVQRHVTITRRPPRSSARAQTTRMRIRVRNSLTQCLMFRQNMLRQFPVFVSAALSLQPPSSSVLS